MRYLIVETAALKPSLETAGEIALRAQGEGHAVTFAWLGDGLPWSDWHLPRFTRWLGCSLERREQRFEAILAREGIRVLPPIRPDDGRLQTAIAWGNAFNGDIEALKQYRYENADLGLGAASSLISFYSNSTYNPLNNLPQVRLCLSSAAIVFERIRKLIAEEKPEVIFTFNGRFATAKPILEAARQAGINVLRHERGATFDRYEIYSDSLHNFAYIRDRAMEAWQRADPVERERIGHEFFCLRRKGDGIGWYSYTADQKRGRIPPRIPGKRRVVYFSSSDDEYAAATNAFKPGHWPDQFSAVRALLEAAGAHPDIELVMRLHPHLAKKSSDEQARWLEFARPGVRLIPPDEKTDSYALLDSADIVVCYGSTIGIEAAYWGKPTILIGAGHYTDSPLALEPKTTQELSALLQPGHTLPAPNQMHSLPFGHYYLTYGTPFRYYKPISLSDGTFLGDRLGWDPNIVYWLRQQKVIKKLSRLLLKRK